MSGQSTPARLAESRAADAPEAGPGAAPAGGRGWRRLVLVGVSLGLLGAALWLATPAALWRALVAIPPGAAVLAALLVAAGYGLAWTRYLATLRAFGARMPAGATLHSFAVGQLAGQVLFSVVGQSVARAATLRATGTSAGSVVTLTFVERLVASLVLGAGALAGALVLFGAVRPDAAAAQGSGLAYPALVLGVAGGTAALGLVLLGPRLMGPAVASQAALVLARVLPTVPLTVLMHAAMLGAWLVLLRPFAPAHDLLALAAACLVVMFVASVPISFGGWGVRELTAAAVFAHLGLAPEVGVAVGAATGALALLVTLAAGALALGRGVAGAPAELPAAPPIAADLGTAIAILGALCVALVWYALRVPGLGGSEITLNLADPFALTALGLALLALWRERGALGFARPVVAPLLAVALVLALGIALGVARFGPTGWALVNRGLGGLVLLGYLAVGPLALAAGGEAWRERLREMLALSAGLVAAVVFVLILVRPFGVTLEEVVGERVVGFAGNRNALAMQALLGLAAIGPSLRAAAPGAILGPHRASLVAALLAALALATSSRIVPVALAAWLLLLAGVGGVPWRRVGVVLAGGLGLWGMAWAVTLLAASLGSAGPPGLVFDQAAARAGSDGERMVSWQGALALWQAHPVLGGGVGAFMQARIAAGAGALVIHSVPFWIAAETGAVGLLAFAWLMAAMAWVAFRLWRGGNAGRALALVSVLAVFGMFGAVHDVFYQRLFWLLAGLMLAEAARPRAASG